MGREDVLFLCGLTVKFSGIVKSKLSVGKWHFLFNCPYAPCSYVHLAVLLSCSTGSKGHVNHVINSVQAFRHSARRLSPLNLRTGDNVQEIGVSWCQILMRCHMEIAETLWRTEGRKYHQSLHLRREREIQESCESHRGESSLIWCQTTNGGSIQFTNPRKIAKSKSFVKVYLEKPQCWGVTVT